MTPGVELLLCLSKHSSYDILGVGNNYSERSLGTTAKIASAELNTEESPSTLHFKTLVFFCFFFFVFETVSHLSQAGFKLTMQLRITVNV